MPISLSTLKTLIKKNAGLIFLVGATLILGYWFFFVRGFESTDNAYVKADMAVLSPRVSGYIVEVHAGDNQQVEAGQLIAKVDDRDYTSRLQQAQSQIQVVAARILSLENQVELQKSVIQQARAGVDITSAMLDRVTKEYQRAKKLLKDGALSQQAMDAAVSNHKTTLAQKQKSDAELLGAQNQLAVIESQLEEGKAQLVNVQSLAGQAQLDLEFTSIKAPFAGRLGRKSMQVGQLVKPGVALGYLVPAEVWVQANFKETQISQMQPGNRAWVEIDAYPGKKFKGRIDSLSPASGSEFSILPPENATGNFTKIVRRVPVKIALKGQDLDLLKPGLSAFVKVRVK